MNFNEIFKETTVWYGYYVNHIFWKKKKKDLNILNVFYISEQYCHT